MWRSFRTTIMIGMMRLFEAWKFGKNRPWCEKEKEWLFLSIHSFYEKKPKKTHCVWVSYLQERHPVWPWETWESSDNNPVVKTRPQQHRVIKWIVRMDNITSPPSDGQAAHTAPTRAQRETAPPGTASSPDKVCICVCGEDVHGGGTPSSHLAPLKMRTRPTL